MRDFIGDLFCYGDYKIVKSVYNFFESQVVILVGDEIFYVGVR